jgi:uncharacterized protein YhbP (UPF0306 family)
LYFCKDWSYISSLICLTYCCFYAKDSTFNRLAIQGIQFSGKVLLEDDALCADAYFIYHKKYLFAPLPCLAMCGLIKLTKVKMTDNTLAFGKKITGS